MSSARPNDLQVEVAVVGAGLMGAATAWELTRRGHSVALLEAFEIGHRNGSSHGSSRIYRRAYVDPYYLGLTGLAGELWREAELDLGVDLLRLTGGIDHGAGRDPAGLADLIAAAALPGSLLTADEAEARWPGMRFDGPVLHHPDAGVVDANAAVAGWARRVAERGSAVLAGTRVLSLVPDQPGGAVLVVTDGPTVLAGAVVVAAGSWLPELAGSLGMAVPLPPLQVTQQQVFHFAKREPELEWPVLVHKAELQVYGLPSGSDGGPQPAFKVAQHDAGTPTTADTRDALIDPVGRERVRHYVEQWLPGLHPEPVAEATCLYTNTPDEQFVLDRVGPVVVASPCSGHGAKFAPAIGRLAADLALGLIDAPPAFALRAGASAG